jgi:hypothetical protein
MKKALLLLLSIPVITEASAIIYRHDVAEEKYRALAQQPQFHCVGEVVNPGMSTIGSCVLIGDKWVLSAAHVFIISEARQDTIMEDGKQVTVYTPVNKRLGNAGSYQFRFQGKAYRGKAMQGLPEYLASDNYDIVLIELAEPVAGITPAVVSKSFDENGAAVTLVGFGVSGNAADPEHVAQHFTKLAGQNTIDSFAGADYKGQQTLLRFDFDHPGAKELSTMGSPTACTLEALCGGGDSGGGMFRERNGQWELVGIAHGAQYDIEKLLKSGYYGQEGSYTRVSAFQQWITENINRPAAQR